MSGQSGAAQIDGVGGVSAQADATPSSASGGPLPQINAPISQVQIEDALSAFVAGILRLSPRLVRPRWQVNDPNVPPAGTDWASLGITARDTQGFPFMRHVKGGPSILYRWPILTVMVSIYGPNAEDNAEALRDALYVGQNLEGLGLLGLKLVAADDVVHVPDLINVQWISHADLRIRLAMEQTRDYRILDIASSDGTITTDTGITSEWLALDTGG